MNEVPKDILRIQGCFPKSQKSTEVWVTLASVMQRLSAFTRQRKVQWSVTASHKIAVKPALWQPGGKSEHHLSFKKPSRILGFAHDQLQQFQAGFCQTFRQQY